MAQSDVLDGDRIARAIELTRFPVPNDDDHAETGDERGLVRAADLIGQLADPCYPQKLNALFHEFVETGTAKQLKLSSPAGRYLSDILLEERRAIYRPRLKLSEPHFRGEAMDCKPA